MSFLEIFLLSPQSSVLVFERELKQEKRDDDTTPHHFLAAE